MKIDKTNLFKINYNFSENMNLFEKIEYQYNKFWLWYGVYLFFLRLFKSLFNNKYQFKKSITAPFLFVSFSNNNDRAFNSFLNKLEDSLMLRAQSGKYEGFGITLAHFLSLFYIPRLLRIYWQVDDYHKKAIQTHFSSILLTFGYSIVVSRYLREKKPEYVIVANDHLMQSRVFTFQAAAIGIKTIYMQHAGVSEKFPSLSYDIAILDGQDSLEKYCVRDNVKIETKLFLLGVPRFKALFDLMNVCDQLNKKKVIGIAFDRLDSLEKVESLIIELNERLPSYIIIIRPHPGFGINTSIESISKRNNVMVSDPRLETVIDFFRKIKYVISYRSFILFEAAIAGVNPISYNFTKRCKNDGYGFIKNSFLKESFNVDDIVNNVLEEKITFSLKYLKRNISNYHNTPDAGELILELFSSLRNNTELELKEEVYKNIRYYTV